MHKQWIEQCTVQRVCLNEGLVLDFEDYNELVVITSLMLTLPALANFPEERVIIDPAHVAVEMRPLLDLSGAVCTSAFCDDGGALHLAFSGGQRIDVQPADAQTAWELYGKRHGYMACLPRGRVRVVRHDIPEVASEEEAS